MEDKIVKYYFHLSKLAAQMVTSTSSENLFFLRYDLQNQNLDFEATKTLILHAWSIYFKGLTYQNYAVKNIFHENPVEVRSFDGITISLIRDNRPYRDYFGTGPNLLSSYVAPEYCSITIFANKSRIRRLCFTRPNRCVSSNSVNWRSNLL